MDLAPLLVRARLFAEDKMTDTATISRAGASTFDPGTGVVSPTSTTVYTGACNIRMPTAVETERLFGEQQITATRYVAWFPSTVTGVRVDDRVVITATTDADLLDVTLKIVAVPRESHTLFKGLGCEVVE